MIPFLDLALQHREHQQRFHDLLDEIVGSSAFVGGDYLDRFEHAWGRACGDTNAVGVANGTDALELALNALGIGVGDEVIVPANTFIATAAAVVRVGAHPVFCDVEDDTLLLSPRTVEEAWGPNVAAIIAVHLFGQPVNMTDLRATADRFGVALIEDAAQAHLGRWDGGVVGALGDVATFSFYPGKNLGALGDGGAITTGDPTIAARVRTLANHGRPEGGHTGHVAVGRNSRLDGLQAAFLLEKLGMLEDRNAARRRLHDTYTATLPESVRQVSVDPRATAVHHLEVVRSPDRDALADFLRSRNIGVGIHYPTPCHRLEPFADFRRAELPVAEVASNEILSLPMFPELPHEQALEVARCVGEFVRLSEAVSTDAIVGSG